MKGAKCMKLGKLQEVDIRKVWPHEQYDFSKWLSGEENIKELGDILNLSLKKKEKNRTIKKGLKKHSNQSFLIGFRRLYSLLSLYPCLICGVVRSL